MNRLDLNGNWHLDGHSPEGETLRLTATVPGSVLNDILCSGFLGTGDIFWRDNAQLVQKYEYYDWVYSKSLFLEADSGNVSLVFEKLDTYCDVFLNGNHLGSCDNANIAHSFSVGGLLRKGENRLEVSFRSPVREVSGKKPLKGAFTTERLYTRRSQCSYGWDWTMRFVTCGISGDAYLTFAGEGIQIRSAYVYTKTVDEDGAAIGIEADTEKFEDGAVLDFSIYHGNAPVRTVSVYCQEPFVKLDVDIPNPLLWCPLGCGEQNLYRLLIQTEGKVLYETNFGIRTVRILELPDEKGSKNEQKCLTLKESPFSREYDENDTFSGFILKVNGRKILCKGANWVPCEPFAKGNTDAKITTILTLAAEAGINMIRVWGGGSFESRHFYEECSRLGIMVTQDFLMACGEYPEEEDWFRQHLQKETEFICERIRNQPCLMWWTGDNENAVHGSAEDTDYRGRSSAYKAIGPVLHRMDPHRRFLASSPYGGKKYASNTVGTTHNTQFLSYFFDYLDSADLSDYKEEFKQYNARFIAEEPCLGAVSLPTLRKFMRDADIFGQDDAMWLYHTQTNPALKKEIFNYILEFAEKLFGRFENSRDRLFKLQYLQYEWIRVSMERVRREKWFCSGVIYWMLNDCWPAAAGWALIDYYAVPKAAWYAFKRGAKDKIISVDLVNGQYEIHICNDSKAWKGKLRCLVVTNDGVNIRALKEMEVYAPENTSTVVLRIPESQLSEDGFLVAELAGDDGKVDRAFYRKGRLEIQPCPDRVELCVVENDCVTLQAKAYVHAIALEGEAVFEDNWFSMLPGEVRKIPYRGAAETEISVDAYTLV